MLFYLLYLRQSKLNIVPEVSNCPLIWEYKKYFGLLLVGTKWGFCKTLDFLQRVRE